MFRKLKKRLKSLRRSASRRLIQLLGGVTREQWRDLTEQVKQNRQATLALEIQKAKTSASISWLAQNHIGPPVQPCSDLISIIMPTWNRATELPAAVNSILAQTHTEWELLIVDDGSTDDTQATLQPYLSDPRIFYYKRSHQGVCEARNFGLKKSCGEIITYLDSDNTWSSDYLSRVSQGFCQHPNSQCVYLAQLVHDADGQNSYVRNIDFDRDDFIRHGGIDLNVFAHKRSQYEQYGGFDTQMRRLNDWDLIARYTQSQAPLNIPAIGGHYFEARWDSISVHESYGENSYRILRKMQKPIESPLRVLYIAAHYPHLPESYIRTELECMRRWGVEVEVWSLEHELPSSYKSDIPVHYGPISDAVDKFQPDLLHVHWLHVVDPCREIARQRNLAITVRSHSFEFSAERVKQLEADETIRAIFLFPHFAAGRDGQKIRSMTSAFNGQWYAPSQEKDRRLVLRCGAGVHTKDQRTFIDAARRCPDHQFIMVLGTCPNQEAFCNDLFKYNKELGSPVEIYRDLQLEEMIPLMGRAGIYMHTSGQAHEFGMPVSIAEAMATGCYVIGRDNPAGRSYIGEAGDVYRDAKHAAALIRNTQCWTDQQWRESQRRSVDRAFREYADVSVFKPLLDQWLQIASESHSMQQRKRAS